MSATTLRAIIAAILLFHGVGHAMGIIPTLGLVDAESPSSPDWIKNWSSRSWLLTNLLGDTLSRVLCFVLYLAGFIGFICTALALLGWGIPHELWRTLAKVMAVVSLAAIVLFWNALILFFPHKVGSLGANIAILACLLGTNWPSEAAIGF